MGVSGKVCKRETLGDMAFIWRGVGALVTTTKDESRDQKSRKIKRNGDDDGGSGIRRS